MFRTIIITTGDELLYGNTTDTNSSFISSRFFGTDFSVVKHITVGDDIESIISVLTESILSADVIITTGGLGPTDDDNTVEAICRIYNISETIDENSRQAIITFFQSMNIRLNEKDYKMASIPEGSHILRNRRGLAPGFILEAENKTLISMPGVPAEAETMFDDEVLPYLKNKFNYNTGNRLQYKVTGIRESDINTKIDSMKLPDHIKWSVCAKSGICDIIFVPGITDFPEKEQLDHFIKNEFGGFLLGDSFNSPESELIHLLREKQFTISTAESCTGGLIGKRLTDIAGSSDVFTGSVTAYSNRVKSDILGVHEDIIEKYGAVSEEVAGEMASGIQKLFKTEIGVSVTGIAGPGGGTEQKPVGTVCFGFYINGILMTRKEFIKGDRERIRTFSSLYVINFLRKYLQNL